MPFLALHVVLSFLLDLAHVLARRDHDKTIELVFLRQQLRLYERRATRPRVLAGSLVRRKRPAVWISECNSQAADELTSQDRGAPGGVHSMITVSRMVESSQRASSDSGGDVRNLL